ncbi:MAG: hypothetical protein HQ472_02690 [Ignavibacteria bacterium]|nr:hypothetical protein [Ignavibacteria bacterium]
MNDKNLVTEMDVWISEYCVGTLPNEKIETVELYLHQHPEMQNRVAADKALFRRFDIDGYRNQLDVDSRNISVNVLGALDNAAKSSDWLRGLFGNRIVTTVAAIFLLLVGVTYFTTDIFSPSTRVVDVANSTIVSDQPNGRTITVDPDKDNRAMDSRAVSNGTVGSQAVGSGTVSSRAAGSRAKNVNGKNGDIRLSNVKDGVEYLASVTTDYESELVSEADITFLLTGEYDEYSY